MLLLQEYGIVYWQVGDAVVGRGHTYPITVGMRELCYCENSLGRILFSLTDIHHDYLSEIEDFLYQ